MDVSAPTGWTENSDRAARGGARCDSSLLERWAYVRDERQVMRVLRVRDFSAVPDGRALLDRLQFASSTLDVVVHVEVVGGARAHRLAARAVHRVGSDEVTSQAAGFRRTARRRARSNDCDNERRWWSRGRRCCASRSSWSYGRRRWRNCGATSRPLRAPRSSRDFAVSRGAVDSPRGTARNSQARRAGEALLDALGDVARSHQSDGARPRRGHRPRRANPR